MPASATIAATARAQQLKAQAVDAVGFGAAEPDFDTPEYIAQCESAILKREAELLG